MHLKIQPCYSKNLWSLKTCFVQLSVLNAGLFVIFELIFILFLDISDIKKHFPGLLEVSLKLATSIEQIM